MLAEDDSSTEVIVPQNQSRQQQVSLPFIILDFSKYQGYQRHNSVSPTPERHDSGKDSKGIYIFDIE